jgi:hypothetical protein
MRVKCKVCGLYRGAKPHTGAMHKAIRANRAKVRLGRLRRRRRAG